MSVGQYTPPVEIAAGSGFALLLALSRAAAAPRSDLDGDLASALDAVGDTAGETWLNLLGVVLDAGPPYDVALLRAATASLDPVELRRHLLGRYAWSWCTIAGAETIDAAAAGEPAALSALLDRPRYYAGRARESLSTLLPLDPAETRRRLLAAVDAGAEVLVAPEAETDLASLVDDAQAALAELGPAEAIERLTAGYRYVPEPEAERIVLVPHAGLAPALVLAQHRSARVIAYRGRLDRSAEERLAAFGRALADARRVEIVGLLARGRTRVSELVEDTGLTRSTVHHHLAQLREARLVDLEGNARAYRYVPRAEALSELSDLLAALLRVEGRQQ